MAVNLKQKDFLYLKTEDDSGTTQERFTCQCSTLEEFGNLFSPGRCRLCDEIAERLSGQRGQCNGSPSWCFEVKELAQRFFLLCIIFTSADSDYYVSLHRRGRKIFTSNLATVKEFDGGMSSTKTGKRRLAEVAESVYFLLAFGDPAVTTVPFFYLIGNQGGPNLGRHREKKEISNDFCFVIPDHSHYQQFYAPGRARPKNKKVPVGRAAYIRPVQAQQRMVGFPADHNFF